MKELKFRKLIRTLRAQILLGFALLTFGLAGCQGEPMPMMSGIHLTDEDSFLFGGEKVADSDSLASLVVGLRFKDPSGEWQICTGSWIKQNWFMTAAHCVPAEKRDLFVYAQTKLPLIGTPSDYRILKTVIHPRYLSEKARIFDQKLWELGNRFDLALVQVDSPVTRKNQFALSVPPSENGDWDLKTQFQSAGFGAESYNLLSGRKPGEGFLRRAPLSSKTESRDGIYYGIQTGSTGICTGDSGAPLFVEGNFDSPVLIGVASSVRNPGDPEVCFGESRFVDLRPAQSWIRAVTQ